MAQATLVPAIHPDHCFQIDDRRGFRENFDRFPFMVRHNLTSSHPLFRIERIQQLARFLENRKYHVHCDTGDVQIGQRWDKTAGRRWTLEETFDRIAETDAWIFLKQVEKDPEYRELLDRFMEEVSELSGHDIRKEQQITEAIIFVTSPRRVTTYHIDRECNFLLQVSGDKEIHVFDRNDRELLPEDEIERFWTVDNNAAVYRPEFEDRARVFPLQPGNGVHIPVNCPHWLKNGDQPSISFSVSYQFKDRFRKYLYQSNHYLRRMGFTPRPPGQSRAVDATKRAVMGSLYATKHGLQKIRAIGK